MHTSAVNKNSITHTNLYDLSVYEKNHRIETAIAICGKSCEITVETLKEHNWNYKIDPQKLDANWGSSIYTDYKDFNLEALKICVEIRAPALAQKLKNVFTEYDCIRFSDGDWYKFTKKNATKENAITYLCDYCNISKESIIADEVIGRNDDDGIADYLIRKYKI